MSAWRLSGTFRMSSRGRRPSSELLESEEGSYVSLLLLYCSRRVWRRNHPKAAIPDPSNRRADGSGTAVTLRLPDPSTRPDVKLLRLNPCKLVLTPLKLAMFNP